MKSLGATHVIDRNTPTVDITLKVKEITSEPVKIVYDAISEVETQHAAYDIVAPGGVFIHVTPLLVDKAKITQDKETAWVFGSFYPDFHKEVAAGMANATPGYLESGEVKVRYWFRNVYHRTILLMISSM